MKKAKFKYYGHLSLVGQLALLIGCCLCLVVSGIKFWKASGPQRTYLSFLVSFLLSV